MYSRVYFVVVLSALHIFFGVISLFTGVVSSIQALVWVAHTISPIWSGTFFIICGCTGLVMCRQKSQYSILCYAAVNSITLITTVVNMQFLRLGLVNHTTLGKTFQKENKDVYILIAMAADGCETLLCLVSLLVSLKLHYDAKHNLFKSEKKEGAFFVQIVSDKDIVVVQSKQNGNGMNGSNGLSLNGKNSKKSSIINVGRKILLDQV